jgi:hypothetical protein
MSLKTLIAITLFISLSSVAGANQQESNDKNCHDLLIEDIRALRIVQRAFHVNCLSAVGLATLVCTSIDLPEPPAKRSEYFYNFANNTWGPGLQERADAIKPRTHFNCAEVSQIRAEIRPSYNWFSGQYQDSPEGQSESDRSEIKVIRSEKIFEWSTGTPRARKD